MFLGTTFTTGNKAGSVGLAQVGCSHPSVLLFLLAPRKSSITMLSGRVASPDTPAGT